MSLGPVARAPMKEARDTGSALETGEVIGLVGGGDLDVAGGGGATAPESFRSASA